MADPPEQPAGGATEERICWQCGETYSAELEHCPEDGSQLVEIDPADTQDMLIGRVFDYRFRIIGKLGEGGMSHVYAARRLEGEGQVALKILKADFLRDPEIRKRFMYEARVISNLDHPNAVDLFDFGQAPDGSFYMVMELLQGGSLADRLDGGALTYREIFQFVPPICGVLGEAHQKDVIHRDLKPENIYLAQMGDGLPAPKLLDFGIAKHLRSRTMTQNDQLWGTPAYMSPEQASGESVAGTADIYAMGVMLYELVAGVLPFRASTAMGYAVKHMHREADPISSLPGIRDIPERLESFILHMLEKDPNDRPPTMARVADELRVIQREEFDERLFGTIPAKQVDHDQLEEPSDDEAVSPGDVSADLDDSLKGAQTELMESPDTPNSPPEAAVSAQEAEESSRGAAFETQPTGFGAGGGDLTPWFQRPVVLGGAVLVATMLGIGGYFALGGDGSGEANASGSVEADKPQKKAASERSTEHATKAAGHAAHVGVKARSIALSLDQGSADREARGKDQGAAGGRTPPEPEPEPAPEPSPEPRAESRGPATGSADSPASSDETETPDNKSQPATGANEGADDKELSEDNVNEALESTF